MEREREDDHVEQEPERRIVGVSEQELERDAAEAVKWFRQAAAQEDAEAQYNLAWCLESGTGVTADVKKALFWYEESARKGVPEAMYNAGCILLGKPGDEDRTLGKKWLVKSANAGYDPACAKLSEL